MQLSEVGISEIPRDTFWGRYYSIFLLITSDGTNGPFTKFMNDITLESLEHPI